MKIDVSKIPDYETMSAEDKLKALEEYEFETPAPRETDEAIKLKSALSKANSEAAEFKRMLREKQTEQERVEAERKERETAMEEELNSLRRERTVSGYLAQCLSLGYNKELAVEAAEAMADNNAAKIIECQQRFLDEKTKEIEANALNKQPTLSVGAPPTATQAEKDATNKMRSYFGLPPIK